MPQSVQRYQKKHFSFLHSRHNCIFALRNPDAQIHGRNAKTRLTPPLQEIASPGAGSRWKAQPKLVKHRG